MVRSATETTESVDEEPGVEGVVGYVDWYQTYYPPREAVVDWSNTIYMILQEKTLSKIREKVKDL